MNRPLDEIQIISKKLLEAGIVTEAAATVDYDSNVSALGYTAMDTDVVEAFQPLIVAITRIPFVFTDLKGMTGIKQFSYEFAESVVANNDGSLSAYTSIEAHYYTSTVFEMYHAHRRLTEQSITTAPIDYIQHTIDRPLAMTLAQRAEQVVINGLEDAGQYPDLDTAWGVTDNGSGKVRITASGSRFAAPFTGWLTGRPVWISGVAEYNGRYAATYISPTIIDLTTVAVGTTGTISAGVLDSVDTGNYWALGASSYIDWDTIFDKVDYMFQTWDANITAVYCHPDIYNRLIKAASSPRAIWFEQLGITLHKSNKISDKTMILVDEYRCGRGKGQFYPARVANMTGIAGKEIIKSLKCALEITNPHAVGVVKELTA